MDNIINDNINENIDNSKNTDHQAANSQDTVAASDCVIIDNDNGNEEIIKLNNKISQLEDQVMRITAESENMRRRYDKTISDTKEYSISNFAKDLLNVLDNLNRALECPKLEDNEIAKNLLSGVELTQKEMLSVLMKYGIQAIIPNTCDKFDYNIHYAVSQIETNDYDNDTIISVMQAGYKIKDRLLRPAIVTVSKRKE